MKESPPLSPPCKPLGSAETPSGDGLGGPQRRELGIDPVGPGHWDLPDPSCVTTSDPEGVSHSQAQAGPTTLRPTPTGGESCWGPVWGSSRAREWLFQVHKSLSDTWKGCLRASDTSQSILLPPG